MSDSRAPRALVFTPSPILTVTIEARADGKPDIHLHAGGQGVWIARMMASLGVDVQLCAPFGGEPGGVLVGLIEAHGIAVHSCPATGSNGGYVHDRRDGDREEVATMQPSVLQRHELDELVDLTLVHALDCDIAVLGGPDGEGIIDPEAYTRLAGDLRTHGTPVVADLSGDYLTAVLQGGLTVLKVSHEELVADGRAKSDRFEHLLAGMEAVRDEGAETVIVSRADDPALVLSADGLVEVRAPSFNVRDHRGAGDSMTAGVAAALVAGDDLKGALRLGGAAGALNVTRHGLGSGPRHLIERVADEVDVVPLDAKGHQ